MHEHNPNTDINIFRPNPLSKTVVFDEPEELHKKTETPYLYLKSTVRNRNSLNLSIFNFSFADINQMLPEIEFQAEEEKPMAIIDKRVVEIPSDCESTKLAQDDLKAKKVTKRTKLLEGACEALTKVFNEIEIDGNGLNLCVYELELVKTIVTKKFIKEESVSEVKDVSMAEDDELADLINNLYKKHESRKRKEEKIKFVFKHTIKNLKKEYFASNELQNCPENEEKFFFHYFEFTHKEKELPLEAFFDPLNTSHALNPKFKTLSKDYLSLLFSSAGFNAAFLAYIETGFVKDYQDNVCKKFKKLFKKLRKRMRLASPGKYGAVISEFITKFGANKRCKLPWTQKEIRNAISGFSLHLQNL